MVEELKLEGIWWLPGDPEKKVCGRLTFDQENGAELSLIVSFKEIEQSTDIARYEFINSITTDGKKVTLYKCLEVNSTLHMTGLLTSRYVADYVFIGIWFTKEDDIRFTTLDLNMSNLGAWFDVNKIQSKFCLDTEEFKVKPWQSYVPKAIVDGYTIQIRLVTNISHRLFPHQELSFNNQVFLVVTSEKEISLEDSLEIIKRLQNFLTFACNAPAYPLSIVAGTNPKRLASTDENKVQLYYKTVISGKQTVTISRFNMLFSYGNIASRFEEILNLWFSISKEFEPSLNMYFATRYNTKMYIEHTFLTLIMALEAYHRRRFGNSEVSEEEHKKRINDILKSAPNEYREWLKEKLRYSNEPSLRKRLKELFESYKDILEDLLQTDESRFTNDLVNTRNYLVHFDEGRRDSVLNSTGIYELSERLKMILDVVFLNELRFDSEDIKRIIKSSYIVYKW